MESLRNLWVNDKIGLDEFLFENPGMTIVPNRTDDLVISGVFKFCVAPINGMEITDSYQLSIEIPKRFPKELSKVFEIGEKIPRKEEYHVNQDDGSLCLGTPLSIMMITVKEPTLIIFSSYFIKPYLYAITLNKRVGGKLVFGELDHGDKGILQDYSEIFNLHTLKQIKEALVLLSIKKRVANKKHCPCGCGFRYGKCNYRLHLEKFRHIANQEWFQNQANSIGRNLRRQ